MSELLAGELAKRGFEVDRTPGAGDRPHDEVGGAVARRQESDGVVVEVDLSTGAVSVKAEASADIAVERQLTATVGLRQVEDATQSAKKQVDEEAEAEAQAAEARARNEVAARLERHLADLQRELDAVTTRVTAEALKEKARSIGEIQEMHEDVEGGELTIKVRL
jgi:hypothetical protein